MLESKKRGADLIKLVRVQAEHRLRSKFSMFFPLRHSQTLTTTAFGLVKICR